MENKISVIISTYNRKKYLETAINSVLNQTHKNYEIIIIDDCSKDGTYEYINSKFKNNNKIKIYRNEKNKGCGISRKNAMSQYAQGQYIIFLDDDDKFIDKNYFKDAIKLFKKNKELSMVCGEHYVNNITNKTKTKKEFNYQEIVDNKKFILNFGNKDYPKPIISVAIIKKEALEYANYQEMKILNDTTIFLRALLYGPMGFINKETAEYLVHGNNISFNCKTGFIIDNLNEKINVFKLIDKFNYSKEEKEKWLKEQLDITIIYFIKGSKPNIINFLRILIWYKNHINNKQKIKQFIKIYKDIKKKNKK